MENRSRYRGLCSDCKHTLYCTYPRDVERPVLQCDEHERPDGPPETRTAKRTRRATDERWNPPVEVAAPGKRAGLCSNCENRDTCVFPEPEGGVWRCEEYR